MLSFYLSMIDDEQEKITFASIYEKYKFEGLHIAMLITKNQYLAEDALHSAFLKILNDKEDLFQLSCSKQRSRIVITVKNKAIDLLRKEKGLKKVSIDDEEWNIPSTDIDFGTQLASEEGFEHLVNCVSKLEEIYKTAFELKYFHNMNDHEVAQTLDIGLKNARQRIFRAKVMLRKILEKEGISNE